MFVSESLLYSFHLFTSPQHGAHSFEWEAACYLLGFLQGGLDPAELSTKHTDTETFRVKSSKTSKTPSDCM